MIQRIRLLCQLLFLALSLSVFTGTLGWRPAISVYHALHVFPTLASIAWWTLPSMALATLLVLVAPLVAGRFYCSYLCPVGFAQDLAGRLGRRLSGRLWLPANPKTIRLILLGAVLVLVALRSSLYLYVDHFGNLGRLYALFGALPLGPSWDSHLLLALLFLVAVAALPLRYPRWFCSSLCPSGTLFMLLQRRALFRVGMSDDCTRCGACAGSCPARCIDADGRIDRSLCVDCLECLAACPAGAISYAYAGPFRRGTSKPTRPERRWFLRSASALVAGGAGAIALQRTGMAASLFRRPAAVVPPGGKSIADFLDRCIGCHTCVSVCPTDVLVPSGLAGPLADFGKVGMDHDRGYCSYRCSACLAVCPTGAISYFPLETKQRIKVGSSRLVKGLCIPYAKKRDCAACHEQCPTGAITMVKQGEVYGPVVNDDYCIGCGSCQFACPVLPERAIWVEPRPTHGFAFNPKQHGPKAVGSGLRNIPRPESSEFPF